MDGSTMPAPAIKESPIWNGVKASAKWAKHDFAEWFVGSWALILGWLIVGTVFLNLLIMDGHFSRGIGEGSGVDPDLFRNVGWMYRGFGALFLVLAVKLVSMGLKKYAWAVRVLGCFITAIVILHATGFGLTALHGKAAGADAVVATGQQTTASNAEVVRALQDQQTRIRNDLAVQVAPLNAEITRLDTDGKINEELATTQKARRKELEDRANAKIDEIDKLIIEKTISSGAQKTEAAGAAITTQKWSPLFVGLAQLTTQQEKPSDGAIYLAGVIFIIFWVIVGDSIAIVLPSALYELHLKDAKHRKVSVSPDVFADLQAKADELERRKANLGEGAEKAVKTKTRKKNRAESLKLLEDQRAEAVKREDVPAPVDAEAEAEEDELELTDEAPAEDAPAAENDDLPDEQEKAA